jgi:hypothetical protein
LRNSWRRYGSRKKTAAYEGKQCLLPSILSSD